MQSWIGIAIRQPLIASFQITVACGLGWEAYGGRLLFRGPPPMVPHAMAHPIPNPPDPVPSVCHTIYLALLSHRHRTDPVHLVEHRHWTASETLSKRTPLDWRHVPKHLSLASSIGGIRPQLPFPLFSNRVVQRIYLAY
jgi:hypothetical protein